MDKAQARRMVLVSVLIIVGAAVAKIGHHPVGTFESLWAASVIAIVLGVVADFAPQVAGPFGLLVALGMLTSGGSTAIGNIIRKGLSPHPVPAVPSVRKAAPFHEAVTVAGRPVRPSSGPANEPDH